MNVRRIRMALDFGRSVWYIVRLAWQAQPFCFLGILLLDLLLGLVPLAGAWLLKLIFDLLVQGLQSATNQRVLQQLALVLLAQAALEIASEAARPLKNYLGAELGRKLEVHVQSLIYAKINSLAGLAPFEDPRFHDILQFASRGAQQGPSQILGTLTTLQGNTITLLSFLVVLLAFSPLLAAVIGLTVVPQLYIQLKIGHQRFEMALMNTPKERLAAYYRHILSSVQSAKELRLFNLADHFLTTFLTLSREVQQTLRVQEVRELRWQVLMNSSSTLIARGAFVAVALAVLGGRVSLGDIALYMSAVVNVQSALAGLIFALSSLHINVVFHKQFTELLALPQPLPIANPTRPVAPLARGIELRGVSFRYSDQHPWVLRAVDLCIPAGRSVALVGLNGAGKTTLVKLLTRLYDPTEGVILWDGIDIRAFDPAELRQHIGAIFQDFVRYDLSAQENIGLGDVAHIADRDSVRRAAQHAGVDEAIERLPHGYQTLLSRWLAGDGPGVDLSGGEWQKIAIARMFMRSADLLILDEPTAALDAQAEHDVYRRFTQLVQGRTSLLISHRFSTVRMADIIAVLEDGRVTEYGSHDELFSLGSTYTKLYTLQAERYR